MKAGRDELVSELADALAYIMVKYRGSSWEGSRPEIWTEICERQADEVMKRWGLIRCPPTCTGIHEHQLQDIVLSEQP